MRRLATALLLAAAWTTGCDRSPGTPAPTEGEHDSVRAAAPTEETPRGEAAPPGTPSAAAAPAPAAPREMTGGGYRLKLQVGAARPRPNPTPAESPTAPQAEADGHGDHAAH